MSDELKPQSIDSPEFRRLLMTFAGALWSGVDTYEEKARIALIAHIDAWGARLSQAVAPAVKYGCHCDLETHMEPDECVIGTVRAGDCSYTHRHANKEACEYWQPIKFAAAPTPDKDDAGNTAMPADWKPAPEDATVEMQKAGRDMLRSCGNDNATERDAGLCWSAMIDAAPNQENI